MWRSAYHVACTRIGPVDRYLLGLMRNALCLGIVLIIYNHLTAGYMGNRFIPQSLFWLLPAFMLSYLASFYIRTQHPRLSLFTWTYSHFAFMLISLGTFVYGIQLTPFPPIDPTLVQWDQLLGFDQLALLHWTYAHPLMQRVLNRAYNALEIQLLGVPILLACLGYERAIVRLLARLIIAFLMGGTLYYLFPTTAPASLFADPLFLAEQHHTALKFYTIRAHLVPTVSDGGMIAFPSFHVIWAILLTLSCRENKLLFFPVALINSFLIAATLCLGWHYLVDAISACLLVIIAIGIDHRLSPVTQAHRIR